MWERRLEREVQTAKASRSHVQVDPSVLEMERRNAEYAERRRVKAIEKDREKMSAEQAHQAKESERIKSLLNAKPPAWKLTKTAEDRARLVCKA